jgi:hypothetical protein
MDCSFLLDAVHGYTVILWLTTGYMNVFIALIACHLVDSRSGQGHDYAQLAMLIIVMVIIEIWILKAGGH